MTPERLFSIVNGVAAVSWLLLAIFPRRRWVSTSLARTIVPAVFAALYIAIVATQFGRGEGGFSSLAGVGALFSRPWLLLAGWIHYLAFDLFVGAWEVEDAQTRGIAHLAVLPCLFLTFMFGPAGWLAYRGLRVWREGR